jgi:multisubunit Na+/H+ antiporter MnhE subunit
METIAIAGVVVGLVVLTTAVGIAWKSGQGAIYTRVDKGAIPRRLRGNGAAITLLQISSEMCSYCAAMRRALGHVAHTAPGVAHIEIDVVDEPDLIKTLGITQTPTTLVVAASGDIVAWIRGAAAEASVRQAIDEAKKRLEEDSHDWTI